MTDKKIPAGFFQGHSCECGSSLCIMSQNLVKGPDYTEDWTIYCENCDRKTRSGKLENAWETFKNHFNTIPPQEKYPEIEKKEAVLHPNHYGGKDNPYEARKVIRAWGLGFNLGNTLKYLCRNGKKNPDKQIEDLEKALFYLQDEINFLKGVL